MRHAFSLVELSIVLVILGLLTGGILTGQNLIRAAELRSIPTGIEKTQTTIMTFRDRYFAYPGDMPNATDFWGATNSVITTCVMTESTTTSTCNGNGDGNINDGGLGVPIPWEAYSIWKHLANAGLIEGSYTGVIDNPDYAVPGQNVPLTKISGVCNEIVPGSFLVSSVFPPFQDDHLLTFGTIYSGVCQGLFLRPEEAWNIDTKIDDGKPGQGRFGTGDSGVMPDCASSSDSATAEYLLDSSDIGCSVGATLWPEN